MTYAKLFFSKGEIKSSLSYGSRTVGPKTLGPKTLGTRHMVQKTDGPKGTWYKGCLVQKTLGTKYARSKGRKVQHIVKTDERSNSRKGQWTKSTKYDQCSAVK